MKKKSKLAYLMVVGMSLVQIRCGGASCPDTSMSGIDPTSGVKVLVNFYGEASASASDTVCYYLPGDITLTSPGGTEYKENTRDSFPPLSVSDSAEVVDLFPQFSDVTSTQPIVVITPPILSYFISDGAPTTGTVTVDVYDQNPTGTKVDSVDIAIKNN